MDVEIVLAEIAKAPSLTPNLQPAQRGLFACRQPTEIYMMTTTPTPGPTPQQVKNLVRALQGEVMPDGCVRGCPVKQDSDRSHNFRCSMVRSALAAVAS